MADNFIPPEKFLESMFANAGGDNPTNAVNYTGQLAAIPKLNFAKSKDNLGWFDYDKPDQININDLYRTANEPRKGLSTALHEMFHRQDAITERPLGKMSASDWAKNAYIRAAVKEEDPKMRFNPGYSPATEIPTRLRQEDMSLPQGQSILNDSYVKTVVDKAYKDRYPEYPNQTREAFQRNLEYALYPQTRWLEQGPPVEVSPLDKIKNWIKTLGK